LDSAPLLSAYEDNCPLRPIRNGRKSVRWTSELEFLRREVRCLFNRCQVNYDSHSWELNREAQWRYRKEARKASKESWRTFCTSVKDVPRSFGYIGLYLGTQKLGFVPWWLLPESVRNLREKPWISCLPLSSLIRCGEGSCTRCCLPYQMFGLAAGSENCYLSESGVGD